MPTNAIKARTWKRKSQTMFGLQYPSVKILRAWALLYSLAIPLQALCFDVNKIVKLSTKYSL